jgi:hypothetical protein
MYADHRNGMTEMARFGLGERKFSWTGTVCSVLLEIDRERGHITELWLNEPHKSSFYLWSFDFFRYLSKRELSKDPGSWLPGPISIQWELIFISSPLEKFC